MKTRDIITGFIVLVILIGVVLFIRNRSVKSPAVVPTATPSITQKVSQTFNGLTIPQGVEQTELKDVTGGASFGIATRTEILANLPALPSGQFYQGRLANSAGKIVILGNLRLAKGGYILEYSSTKYPGYNTVIVAQAGKTILQGSF